MKRHFLTGLKAFAVGVMTLLAVSCYDDSKLWGEVEQIKKDLTALQEKLNQEVNTLNSVIGALEAKVAVVKVEKNAAGNYVLTFSNNETLEISAADANANNTGLVTTVTEGDVTYWAVVGADGKVTKLDAVVHPDTKLSFKVDPETGILLVSYDGQSYESTGVFVNDDTTFNVVEKFVNAEGYVVITVGGVDYQLPKVSANTFEILSGMVFFSAGETKTIPVDMSGIVTSMVAKQPSGWTVELTDGGLNVTAPAEESEEGDEDDWMGDDWGPLSADVENDTYGKIEIWVVTEDGKTIVGTLTVSLEGMFAEVSYAQDDKKGTMVTVEVPMVELLEWNDDWTEQIPTGEYEVAYYPVFFGACEADKFDGAKLSSVIEDFAIGEDEAAYPSIYGVYELDEDGYPEWLSERTVSLTEMLGAEPEVGKTYVVWAYNRNADAYQNGADSFILSYYAPTKTTMSVPSTSWCDAELNVTVEGVDEFVLLATFKEDFDYYVSEAGWWNTEYRELMAKYGTKFSFMDVFLPGTLGGAGLHGFAGEYVKGSFKNKLTKLGVSSEISYEYNPEQEIVLCVLPLSPFKSEYTIADVDTLSFKLGKLATGGTATVSFGEPTADFKTFTLPMTSTSSYRTVYKHWTTENFKNIKLETGETMQDYMMKNYGSFSKTDKASFEVYAQSLTKGTSYTVAAMAIDADGKCSEVVTKEVITADYPYDNTNMKVEVTAVEFNPEKASQVTVTYKVTGATSIVVNGSFGTPTLRNNEKGASTVEGYLMDNGPEYYYIKKFDAAEDGTVKVTYNNYSKTNKWSYAVAYKYENKKVTALTNAVITDLSTFNN